MRDRLLKLLEELEVRIWGYEEYVTKHPFAVSRISMEGKIEILREVSDKLSDILKEEP